MCGFFQVIERGRPVDMARFAAAFALSRHRGPDYSGTTQQTLPATHGSPELGVASGHHRLPILDLDPRAHQPFTRGQATLLYNGEIYNFADLKNEAAIRGVAWQTTGDTEVVFEGLRLVGLDFLKRANGMWAFTFLDSARRRLWASRDRYGKKPLFWYQDDTRLCCSSTIASICRYLNLRPRLRESALRDYLISGKMFPPAGDSTHLHEIRAVPAGHHLRVDLLTWRAELEPYFTLPPPTAPRDPLAELLRSSVMLRLVSDRQVGLLLSGGVDSSLVLAVLRAIGRHEQVHCFIGEPGRSADAQFASQAAQTVGVTPTLIQLDYGARSFDRFLQICRHHEKGFPLMGNSMAMAEMYEAIAQQNIPVVLDGTGGDEIFAGYHGRYFPAAVREAIGHRDVAWLRETAWHNHRQRQTTVQTLGQWATRNSRWHFDSRQFRKNLHPLLLLLGIHSHWWQSPDPLDRAWPTLHDALVADIQPGGQLGEWLWHNDRNAMMAGIENRSPLLDYRLAAYLGSGYRAKFHRQFNKYELRQVFDQFVPLPTQWRSEKQGFRWNRKAFLRQNRERILELIANSRFLQERFSLRRYLDTARRSDWTLTSSLTGRLLCLAGVDHALPLRPA